MLFKATYIIHPSEYLQREELIRQKIAGECFKNIGFITRIHSLKIGVGEISSRTGDYIYNIEANVDTFLPKVGDVLEGIVKRCSTIQQPDATENVLFVCCRDRLEVIIRYGDVPSQATSFRKDKNICPGDRVEFIVKATRYHNGVYTVAGRFM